MLPKTPAGPVNSPAPGVIPETVTDPVSTGIPVAGDADNAEAQSNAQPASAGEMRAQPETTGETRRGRSRRQAHRTRLHGYAIVTVALVAYLIALAATNTTRVKVNWVFGSSHVALVWLVLFAAIIGWLLGLVITAAFHWRTRTPRGGAGASRREGATS